MEWWGWLSNIAENNPNCCVCLRGDQLVHAEHKQADDSDWLNILNWLVPHVWTARKSRIAPKGKARVLTLHRWLPEILLVGSMTTLYYAVRIGLNSLRHHWQKPYKYQEDLIFQEPYNRTANTEQTKVQEKRCLKAHITCIVLEVLDLHGRLGCAVAKTPVLLQQLQTFISVINWTPTVVRTQHFNR